VRSKKNKIYVTIGDPAGCGPEVAVRAIDKLNDKSDICIVGDGAILSLLPVFKRIKNKVEFIDLNSRSAGNIKRGHPSKITGKLAVSYIDKTLELIKNDKSAALVTAPVSKEAVQKNIPGFKGHTEYLAEAFNCCCPVMMMCSEKLKIVLLTRHVPLGKVKESLLPSEIKSQIKIVHRSLKDDFKIKKPKIALASVNPHAGINTFMLEEENILKKALKSVDIEIEGPFPADTLFTPEKLKYYDCFLCSYHDQGMIPFKLLSFKTGVNLTCGLPVIRTSPAHGTAFDLMRVGKKPDCDSMYSAIKLVQRFFQ